MLTLLSLVLYSQLAASSAAAETTFVLPAGSTIATEIGSRVHLETMQAGDTLYLRVDSAVLANGRVMIPAGSFIEGTLRNGVIRHDGDRTAAFALRVRRLIGANGSIGEFFGEGTRAPDDSGYRRGVAVEARVILASPADVIPARSTIQLVAVSPFTVETRRSLAGPPFAGDVRFSATPPGRECYVRGAPGTPDIVVTGIPATPAIGDQPATPGAPDVWIPGAPAQPGHWDPC